MSDSNLVKNELISRSNDEIYPFANPNPEPEASENNVNQENNSVSVSIEPNHEREIYEIRFDGSEDYKEYKIEKHAFNTFNSYFYILIFQVH
jgi:hypothetical protein